LIVFVTHCCKLKILKKSLINLSAPVRTEQEPPPLDSNKELPSLYSGTQAGQKHGGPDTTANRSEILKLCAGEYQNYSVQRAIHTLDLEKS